MLENDTIIGHIALSAFSIGHIPFLTFFQIVELFGGRDEKGWKMDLDCVDNVDNVD